MIDNGTVKTEVRDGIATVRFVHPKSNSLPGTLLANLAETISALGADNNARVIVLRSEGEGAFCAGASFDELKSISDEKTGTKFFMGFATLILAMIRCPKFIITRVHGKAVGGGVGIVAASDYAIASEAASIRLSELAVGIGPFVVGPAVEHKVGTGPYSALSVDADWRDARWAERHGLYASVYSSVSEVDAAVVKLAQQLAASNPEAMTQLKRVFWAGTEGWEELLPKRAALSGRLVLSDFTKKVLSSR